MKLALPRERKSLIFLIMMSWMMLESNEFVNVFPFEDDEDLTTSFSYESLSKYN